MIGERNGAAGVGAVEVIEKDARYSRFSLLGGSRINHWSR